ncbi:hypothetical protein DH2020_025429 [Rehmannia glutinosa]|uniref:Enhancer of polycomb-like protein n=1 Tax=Rehmannia glutinosa TaxID=99300 RepID=A0ABR0W405_REHGL
MNSSSSNVKLKRKVGADEVKGKKIVDQIQKSEPVVGSSVSNSPFVGALDDDDDDEENLEQNARMLSSRFDPNCTGFSSKRKSSVSQTANELSFPVSSARDSISRRAKSSDGGESASGDDNSRSLRPRREDKGKETKLHHIKYDDRDEEWVNLEEENFKLLLHRNEVPGKVRSRKRSTGVKDLHTEQTVPPADNDSCVGDDLDSEPIASWLANASKLTGNKPGFESASGDNLLVCGTVDKSRLFQRGKHVVYARKKHQKKSAGSSFVSRDAKACANAPWPVTSCLPTTKGDKFCYGRVDSDKQLWSFDDKGKLALNDVLLEVFWLLHDIFMLQHGVIMTTSPAVFLEMLFIDSNLGLRFLLFEGCLTQALAIVFLILTVFSQSDEHWNGDMKIPVTSIKFQLSSVQDLRKQLVFAFYSFSRLESSKWLYLESKILRQCLLIKQLSVKECTYGNIKELECGILPPCKPRVDVALSSSEDFKKKFELAILPMGDSRETFNTRSQSAFSLTAKPGNVPQFALSFSAAPNFFLSLHLQLLMEHGFAGANLQHQEPLYSLESSENGGQPVVESAELCSVAVQDATEKEVHEQIVVSAPASVPTHITSPTSNPRSDSTSGGMTVDIPSLEQVDIPFAGKGCISRQTSDVIQTRGRGSTISSPLGHHSPVWSDSQPNFMPDGFSNGPKKPRTQVQYTLPFVGYDFSTKQETPSSRSLPCKRIRRASLKKISDGSGNNQKNMELLTCFANVLITHGDKGWRECGAHVVLEFADHNEWKLAVKLSGVTKFSYKVKHILQPGSNNRYSHAMIWKGGKDWVLEFRTGASGCFSRRCMRSVTIEIFVLLLKNIPIPGVRLVEESDDYGDEVPFVRNSTMYFRQVQTDAEMAMDPSHILYDMDSDDEQWLMAHKNSTDKHKYEISEEFFEMAMDMFEKFSYAKRRDNFTDAEIEELAIGIGSVEAAKLIYQHWRQKREKMRMPLIRHLQPPPWERYQRQLKEWEHNVARGNSAVSVGTQEKVPPPEKPPMFAFCLKPRGLDVPNKALKHRSQRKLPVSGLHHAFSGDQDSLLVSGRRSNGHAFGDEKMLYASSIHDSSDVSPSLHPSTRVLSSRDAHFTLSASVSEWKVNRKVHKNKRKKLGSYQRTRDKNGVQQWNMGGLPEISSQSHYYFDGPHRQSIKMNNSDLQDEFHLRDALGAQQHARNMAKLKREKAQKLFCRADLAVHKAVTALMNAEAIKDSFSRTQMASIRTISFRHVAFQVAYVE